MNNQFIDEGESFVFDKIDQFQDYGNEKNTD